MRWTEPLDEILGSRAKVRLLRRLQSTDQPVSGREAARAAGVSHTAALRALDELYAQNVVSLASGSRGVRFKLNRDHALVNEGIVPLLLLEERLDERLAAFVLELAGDARSVLLFGSSARGRDAPESDLDVFVVVSDDVDAERAFDELAGSDASARLGKRISPIVWSVSRLKDAHATDDRLLAAILQDARLLAGDPLLAIIHQGSTSVTR